MRKRFVAPVALAAVAVLSAGLLANAADGDKVTGGGQILADDQQSGAGSTIAFVALQRGDAGEGQVQYVQRDGATGQGQTVYHGTVTCVEVTGNTAFIAGAWRDGGDFEIFVEDNGQGAESTDLIFVDNEPVDPNCQEDDGEDDREPVALARGNVVVH